MKRGTMLLIAAGVCLLAFQSQRADATLITISIEAEVDSVEDFGNYLEGRINPGDIITGTYTYESTTPDSNPSSSIGHYWHYAGPAGISLEVEGFDFASDPSNVNFLVGIVDNGTSGGLHDSYWLCSYSNVPLSNGASVDEITWALEDSTATALSSDALPTSAPVLEQWESIVGLRLEGQRGGYYVSATVTSAIPEPATIVLLALGGLVVLRRRN
jgi:hypothetical protein